MFDWQDLQYFLALARLGSLSAAARDLGVDHATVGRRVASLESALNLKLADRLPRSCPLTDNGRMIATLAEDMDSLAHLVQRRAKGASSSLSGTVRISAPPALSTYCIAPHIALFRQKYPELKIVLLASAGFAAVGRGEADIALRLSRPNEADAITRKIGSMNFAAYAAIEYLSRPADSWEFIAYDENLDHVPQQKWLRRIMSGRPIAFEANDLFGQRIAVQAGVGIAVLPTFMGDQDASLIRLEMASEPPKRNLWLITYPDLRRSPAVRAVMDFVVECIQGNSFL